MITEDERKSFGFLGRIPAEVLDAPSPVTEAWKKLTSRARQVAAMRRGPKKTQAAKEVEAEYHRILGWARTELEKRT